MDKGLVQDSQGAIKEDALRSEVDSRWNIVKSHYQDWEKVAKDDYKFALGDQWTEEERNALKDQARPTLTFNRIRSIINLISGYQRENASRIKVNPEGGEDKIFSEVMDRTLKAIDKWTHLAYKMGYWFDDGCYCGKGFLEAIIKYDNDPIRGEIDFKQRSPYQIKVDPECIEYDINDGAMYAFKIVRLTKQRLLELYPTKKKLISGFVKDNDDPEENGDGSLTEDGVSADDDYGNEQKKRNYVKVRNVRDDDPDHPQDGKYTVKEYWRIKMVTKYFVINKDDGEVERFDTKEEAQEFINTQNFGKIVERSVKEMWVAAYVCGWVVQDEKSPFEPYYSGFPFFRFLADWAPNAESEEWRVQGITRPLKDPQKEKNKSKSQYLHILNTQANSGWIGDDNALNKADKDKLATMGAKPGITVWKKPGTELREIQPKGPNQGHLVREQQADEEFKQISGINPDLLGFQEGTASGRAISMRIKQSVLSLSRLFYNYRYSKEIIGKFLLQMVPMVFDKNKMIKVLGPQYMATAIDKEKYPEGLKEGHVEAFLKMVDDNKYDVIVTEAGENSTIRFEIFQELSELLKAGAPIPIDLLVSYMDLPNSQEVIDKIKESQAQAAAAAASAKGVPTA